MKQKRGWSLVEILVVLFLVGLVSAIVSRLLGPTMALAWFDTERASRQSQLEVVFRSVEATLQRSSQPGVGWTTNSNGCLLAIHPMETNAFTAGIKWEPTWNCYIYELASSNLYQRSSLPSSVTPPPTDQPKIPTSAEKLSLMANPQNQARLLCHGTSKFDFRWEPGPLAHVTIETSVTVPGRTTSQTLRAERRISMRNTI